LPPAQPIFSKLELPEADQDWSGILLINLETL
jgi:hypothetical protein